jgi:hypothetical protein
MLNDSLKTLSATPPPAHRLWKFKTAKTAKVKINELEAILGLPASPLDCNLISANARIRELESLLAHTNASKTAPAIAAPIVATPAAAPVVEKFGRERFIESCRAELSRPPEKTNSHLTGRARFCAANHKISGQLAAPIPAPAGELTEKLTGRNRFAAAVKKDFAAIQKQK